jgi:hypothetical protein
MASKKGDDDKDPKEDETNEDETAEDDEESSRVSAAKTMAAAMRETAQKYLDAAGIKIDLEAVEDKIRDQPLFSMVIAAGAGFIIGGGLTTVPVSPCSASSAAPPPATRSRMRGSKSGKELAPASHS